MKKQVNFLVKIKNKVFDLILKFIFKVKSNWQDERMNFVIGFCETRFSYATFWINGREQFQYANTFEELEFYLRYFEKKHHFPKVSRFMFLKMWSSRKAIRFQNGDVRLEILTYWHF
jgi:hypothetical protein